MKMIDGKMARIYNYVQQVMVMVSNYYNYEFVVGDSATDIRQIDKEKCAFLGIKDNTYAFLASDSETKYQDAEVISLVYRVLEELRIPEVLVNIKASDSYDLAKLEEYLGYLDVDYEIDNAKSDEDLSFEVMGEDKSIILAKGSIRDRKIDAVCNISDICKSLEVVFENRDLDVATQVFIMAESAEEKIAAMKLAQDLRWCEIVVDVSYNKTLDEQRKRADKASTTIIMSEEDLNKGIILVKDNLTGETTKVDEAEIIDYIVSNL